MRLHILLYHTYKLSQVAYKSLQSLSIPFPTFTGGLQIPFNPFQPLSLLSQVAQEFPYNFPKLSQVAHEVIRLLLDWFYIYKLKKAVKVGDL